MNLKENSFEEVSRSFIKEFISGYEIKVKPEDDIAEYIYTYYAKEFGQHMMECMCTYNSDIFEEVE